MYNYIKVFHEWWLTYTVEHISASVKHTHKYTYVIACKDFKVFCSVLSP